MSCQRCSMGHSQFRLLQNVPGTSARRRELFDDASTVLLIKANNVSSCEQLETLLTIIKRTVEASSNKLP